MTPVGIPVGPCDEVIEVKEFAQLEPLHDVLEIFEDLFSIRVKL